MNKQQILDRASRHLIYQRVKASDGGLCCYRTRDGRMCAIGCLIPEENYSLDLEGRSASTVAVLTALGFPSIGSHEKDFLDALQSVHDRFEPELWKEELQKLALRWRLLDPFR